MTRSPSDCAGHEMQHWTVADYLWIRDRLTWTDRVGR